MLQEITDTTEDSDSDVEDIRNVIEKSQSQLSIAESLFSRSCNGTIPQDNVRSPFSLYFIVQSRPKFLEYLQRSVQSFFSWLYSKFIAAGILVIRLWAHLRYFFLMTVWHN